MKSLALFMGLLLVSTVAFAGASKKKDKDEGRGEKFRKELGLSEDQLKKMKEIREKKKADHKESRSKLRDARKAFHEAMGNPKATKEELLAKFNELESMQTAAHRARFETMLEIRGILNQEQLAKFQAKKGHWREKMKERRRERFMKKDEE